MQVTGANEGALDPDQLAQAFYDLFVVDRRGAAIYDYLCSRFNGGPSVTGGIDAILRTYRDIGARMVLDEIALQVHRAQNSSPVHRETDDDDA